MPTNENQQFVCPKEPKICRIQADENLDKALGKVPDAAHFDEGHERKTATLYVGNLNFQASEADLSNALNVIFKRIRVEKVTIPQRNGKSLGYAFIELSWAVGAPVKMFDLCVKWSALVFVNSRPIYFREIRNKNETVLAQQEKAHTSSPKESTATVLRATTSSSPPSYSGVYLCCGCRSPCWIIFLPAGCHRRREIRLRYMCGQTTCAENCSGWCAENCSGPATQKGCLTVRSSRSYHMSGLADPDNSVTFDRAS